MNNTMDGATRILVVDDDERDRVHVSQKLKDLGNTVQSAEDGLRALEKLAEFDADVVITDLMMPRMDGFELTRQLRDSGSAPPVIVMTALGGIDRAIAVTVDCGAFWYLEKPVNLDALRALVDRAATLKRERTRYQSMLRQLNDGGVLGELIGTSGKMQEVLFDIQQIAPSRASVLLVGESGTGKRSAAKAICEQSPRHDAPFLTLNCAATPDPLLESELFGHEKGAFLGALDRRRGCFELALGGTVLLEEIGAMPKVTQTKLLRMLEDNVARRLGGMEYPVDVRVIASSIEPLDSL
jgi:DNA-binding NtrC family response regulator